MARKTLISQDPAVTPPANRTPRGGRRQAKSAGNPPPASEVDKAPRSGAVVPGAVVPGAVVPGAGAGGVVIERVAVGRINPAPYNPRRDLRPGDAEWEKLRRSIEAFGYVDPLIWNKRTGTLVGGHQRLAVLAREFGATEVDVSVVDLDEAQECALNVALNKVSGEWDNARLADLLAELQAAGDIDVALTGYDAQEIQMVMDQALADLAHVDSGDEEADSSVSVTPSYGILVTCNDEADQRRVFEQMQATGRKCRVMTL